MTVSGFVTLLPVVYLSGQLQSSRRSIRRMGSRCHAAVQMLSWEGIQTRIETKTSSTGVNRIDGALYVKETRDGTLRLFGAAETAVRVTLFRDPAYWCPYCQRVQLQLEHKKIPYRIRMINMRCYGSKPSYYRNLVPSGAIPAVSFDDEHVMTESLDIMMAIEQIFPENKPLIPLKNDNPAAYEAFRRYQKLERQVFSGWFQYMFSGGFSAFGLGGDRLRRSFLNDLDAWNAALKENNAGPFLLGEEPCLVDILAVPFVERMVASGLYWKAIEIRKEYQAIDSWLTAMEMNVPAYAAMKGDLYSTVHDLPPQVGSTSFDKGSERFQRFVDGQDGSWDLPLCPIAENYPEAVAGVTDEEMYRIEAAKAVLSSGEKLVKFALRGTGSRPRTVAAPLSDPDASPGTESTEWVTLALQAIALALTDGIDDSSALNAARRIPKENHLGVTKSLTYLRDRVGVPRDMSFGAARQLRAHLNWFCKILIGEEEWTKLRPTLDVQKA